MIPKSCTVPIIVIYTDAYFVQDGQRFSPGSTKLPTSWNKAKSPNLENGWGYVIHFKGETHFAAGRAPPWLLRQFCSRKAYIYFLEVLAQLVAFVSCRNLDSTHVISFIDNSSGFFALKKGYCRDEPICNLIAATWRLIANLRWHVHLEWVRSALNISDKVSRHEFGEMEMIEAKHDQVDTTKLFSILLNIAKNHDYTYGQSLNDILAVPLHQHEHLHTGKTVDLAPVWEKDSTRSDHSHIAGTKVTDHSRPKKDVQCGSARQDELKRTGMFSSTYVRKDIEGQSTASSTL